MAQSVAVSARRSTLVLAVLLAVSAAAWGVFVWQARAGQPAAMAKGLTMGMNPARFLALWTVMMAAMMLPGLAPAALAFARGAGERRSNSWPGRSTWLFVGAYLGVWAVTGLFVYLAAVMADGLADRSAWLMAHGAQLGGVSILLAGAYQLSAPKRTCLARCRSAGVSALDSRCNEWRGAMRTGLAYGLACLGSSGILCVLLLLPLGMMNLGAMLLLTLIISAEKAMPLGMAASRVTAAALIACGVLALFVPAALPTVL